MASTFSCIGLGVDSRDGFGELVARLGAASDVTSTGGGITMHHWVDPSGAMVGLAIDERNDLAHLFPTLDPGRTPGGTAPDGLGAPRPGGRVRGAVLASLERPHAPMVTAAVLVDGEQVTALGFESAEWWQLAAVPRRRAAQPVSAHVVALGTAMAAYPDATAFAASQGPSPRLGEQSFIPGGMFGDPPTADALLTGTVLAAERRTNTLTGQDFVVAAVRTIGFTATVCLPGVEHPELPVVGGILSGGAVMTASLDLD